MKSPIIGIDLGTTHSLVGVIKNNKPLLLKKEESTLIPSVVELNNVSGTVVSVGQKAKTTKGHPTTIYSSKRFLGRSLVDIEGVRDFFPFDFSKSDEKTIRFNAGEKTYTPVDIAAFILQEIKKLAEENLQTAVTQCVVTVPAYFNDSQRLATQKAGELAGLEVIRILNEPTAACLAYGLDKKTKGNLVVFDLGGGTFDISILKVENGIFEVLATNGNTELGGDDFDHAIAYHLNEKIKKEKGLDFFSSPEKKSQLIQEAEKIKKQISQDENVFFEVSVSRAEVQEWVLEVLKKVEDPCRQCLSDSNLSLSQINEVILVGGSTRFFLVKDWVRSFFKKEPLCSINPDEVVALGATVQANVLSGNNHDVLLLDVVPLSLGLETMGGIVSKIISRNTTIPTSASETFTTYVDGQTSIDLHIVQGERELAKDNRSLGRFQLRGIPPLPAGVPKVEVEYIVDANGVLNVKASELRTGLQSMITVTPAYGLTDQTVEDMLLSSFENAEQDFKDRFLIEAKVEAEHLVRSTEKSLASGKNLLTDKEEKEIRNALEALQKSVKTQQREEIKSKIEALDIVAKPFAEKLLDHSIQEALKGKSV